jgi:type IV secretory pathway VirB4 component
MIYKRLWQQAVERRDVRRYPTPVFMWVDEAQYFINEDDMLFQTTARSARACTVMITQNISNYYATIGGSNAKERVDSLLGNLVTKIFHANNDYVTNEWAAKTIAQTYHKKESLSAGKGASVQMSKELAYQVQPQEFTELATGGEENGSRVEAIITSLGTWSSGTNYLKTHFDQNFEKKRG